MPYRLVAIKGPLRGRTFLVVKTETRIGRDPSNDLVIPDEYVSRHHATIVARAGRHLLVNASPNGTKVNGRWVERARLNDGDEIALGSGTVLRYESARSAAPAGTGRGTGSADRAPAEPTPTPAPETPSALLLWRRRPKLLIGGLVYLAALIALGVFLAGRRRAHAPKSLPELSRRDIERDILRELDRPRDRRLAQRALERAMELYRQRYVDPANLYAAITAFKEAEAYLGTSLSKPEHIKAFDRAVGELVDIVDRLYFEALALQKMGRYDEARDRYARILQYINDPGSLIYRNVARRIKALKPFITRPRWSRKR